MTMAPKENKERQKLTEIEGGKNKPTVKLARKKERLGQSVSTVRQ